MPQCLVIPLYLCAGKVSAVRGERSELMPVTLPLPPMRLPQ